MDAYCENGECRVVLYRTDPAGDEYNDNTNCPGCGQFGRLKDDPKEQKRLEEY